MSRCRDPYYCCATHGTCECECHWPFTQTAIDELNKENQLLKQEMLKCIMRYENAQEAAFKRDKEIDSLRLELQATEFNRLKGNEYLISERDKARAQVEILLDALKKIPNISSHENDNQRKQGWENPEPCSAEDCGKCLALKMIEEHG